MLPGSPLLGRCTTAESGDRYNPVTPKRDVEELLNVRVVFAEDPSYYHASPIPKAIQARINENLQLSEAFAQGLQQLFVCRHLPRQTLSVVSKAPRLVTEGLPTS